jgi:hypothetical protein
MQTLSRPCSAVCLDHAGDVGGGVGKPRKPQSKSRHRKAGNLTTELHVVDDGTKMSRVTRHNPHANCEYVIFCLEWMVRARMPNN